MAKCNLCRKREEIRFNIFHPLNLKCEKCKKAVELLKEIKRGGEISINKGEFLRVLEEKGLGVEKEEFFKIFDIVDFNPSKNMKQDFFASITFLFSIGKKKNTITIKLLPLVEKIIKSNYNKDKLIEELLTVAKKELRKHQVKEEQNKILERKEQRQIREEAEKGLYGQVKSKRETVSKDLKEMVYDKYNNECSFCGSKEGLHIHHKDHNPKNNTLKNLILVCGVCHKKLHMKVR